MAKLKPIVVSCPPFDENVGGSIVLHLLVDRLRREGFQAYAYPLMKQPADYIGSPLQRIKAWFRNRKRNRSYKRFVTHPSMDVPLASKSMLEDSIVVYPEIVFGNPFKAKSVVRWLLNKKGALAKGIEFGADELTFYYQEAFLEHPSDKERYSQLRINWLRDDIYFDRYLGNRSGSCRMVRKAAIGNDFKLPDNDASILLDGMSHQEIADVFNRTKIFYCHDLYTMYAYYAVLCGCTPVVVPNPQITSTQWRQTMEFKYGVAYGDSEIEWARQTRDLLINDMSGDKDLQLFQVRNFAEIVHKRFSKST